MATDWPELSDELARKAIETTHALVHKHLVEAEIDEKQLRVAVDAIYDIVSGLVPWDIANMIYAVRKDLGL